MLYIYVIAIDDTFRIESVEDDILFMKMIKLMNITSEQIILKHIIATSHTNILCTLQIMLNSYKLVEQNGYRCNAHIMMSALHKAIEIEKLYSHKYSLDNKIPLVNNKPIVNEPLVNNKPIVDEPLLNNKPIKITKIKSKKNDDLILCNKCYIYIPKNESNIHFDNCIKHI